MKRRAVPTVLIFFCICIPSWSLTIFADFSDLLEEADLVCVGVVLRGEYSKGDGCTYVVSIESIQKGSIDTEEITLGHYQGLRTGCRYLFLLRNAEHKDYDYQIFFEGMTSFEISYELLDTGPSYCIQIPLEIIRFRTTLYKEPDLSKNGKLWGCYYYKLDDILEYILKHPHNKSLELTGERPLESSRPTDISEAADLIRACSSTLC